MDNLLTFVFTKVFLKEVRLFLIQELENVLEFQEL